MYIYGEVGTYIIVYIIYIRNDIVVYKWFYEMSFVIYHDNNNMLVYDEVVRI